MTDLKETDLKEIEDRLAGIQTSMRLLVAIKLIDKGHAPNLKAAMQMTHDREAMDRIFAEQADREGTNGPG